MTMYGVFCQCGCHQDQGDGRVHVSDPIGCETACSRCRANHRPVYAKDPNFRRTKFDPPAPFDPTKNGEGAE